MIPATGNDHATDERPPVTEMTDRELLEEVATNLRAAADGINAVSDAVRSEGVGGILKGLFSNGRS